MQIIVQFPSARIGAELSAACVMAGLKALPKNPVEPFLAVSAASEPTQ